MRLQLTLLVSAFAVFLLAGCQATINEYHTIKQIPRVDSQSRSSVTQENTARRGDTSTTSDSKTTAQHQSHTGVWLARYVYTPKWDVGGMQRPMTAIEILFCPSDRTTDFTKCRVGVGWSRDRPRLGKEVIDEPEPRKKRSRRSRRSRK